MKKYDWEVARKNLRDIRLKYEMTQKFLSNELKYSVSSVSSYEVGRTLPDINYIIVFCEYFGITIDDLFRKDIIKDLRM